MKKLDITVERNSFGRQVDSFEAELDIKGIEETLKVYLLEHLISLMLKRGVEILSTVGDKIVAVKQGKYLGVSFHPELTDDYRVTHTLLIIWLNKMNNA